MRNSWAFLFTNVIKTIHIIERITKNHNRKENKMLDFVVGLALGMMIGGIIVGFSARSCYRKMLREDRD